MNVKHLFIRTLLLLGALQPLLHAHFRGHALPADLYTMTLPEEHEAFFPGPHFEEGELVFVRDQQHAGTYRIGIFQGLSDDGRSAVKPIASAETWVVDDIDLKKFAPLWRCVYQPQVDLDGMRASVHGALAEMPAQRNVFIESVVLAPTDKLIVVGDLHGCRSSLAYLFQEWSKRGILSYNLELEDGYKIVFLGDYGDRGPESVEVYYMLLELKACNPNDVFLCRGNHEDRYFAELLNGLSEDWHDKFGNSTESEAAFDELISLFERLPHAVLFNYKIDNTYNTFLCAHAGVEPIPQLIQTAVQTHETYGPQKQTLVLPQLGTDNQFNWLDFYAKTLATDGDTRITDVRGEPNTEWSRQVFANYAATQTSLSDDQPIKYRLYALVKGHQHEIKTTGRLRHQEKNGSSWKQFADGRVYNIAEHDVIALVSMPEALPGFDSDVYGMIEHYAPDGFLYTPYIHTR